MHEERRSSSIPQAARADLSFGALRFRVQSLGFRVLGCRVSGSGFTGFKFRVAEAKGLGVQDFKGSRFRGLRFGMQESQGTAVYQEDFEHAVRTPLFWMIWLHKY